MKISVNARIALAASATAALILIPVGIAADNDDKPDGPSVAPRQDVAAVLAGASKAAAAEPVLKAGPNQYLYFESKSRQDMAGAPVDEKHRRVWLPVTEGRPGLLQNVSKAAGRDLIWLCDGGSQEGEFKGRDKLPPKVDLAKPPTGCESTGSVYRTGLPTSADAMVKWLYANSQGGNPPDVQAYRTVGDVLRESYVPPKARAALFAAVAKLPGVKVVPKVRDSAGRQGIAVGQAWHGERQELIFDPKTYAYLGERTVVDHDNTFRPKGSKTDDAKPLPPAAGDRQKEGKVLYESAQLKTAVVDNPGDTPA